jgi:hypothetical protein
VAETQRTTREEARRVGDAIGGDWSRYDLEQFRAGIDVEFEHGAHDPQTDVTGLLVEAVGTATEEDNGKLRVALGGETEVLQPPQGKDMDEQTIVDLRRMLTRAGLARPSDDE